MSDPDKDQPESMPTRLPLWSRGSIASFSPLPHVEPVVVVVPFPLSLQVDPVRGAILAGLFTRGTTYTPEEVAVMAEKSEGGFRFEGDEIERISL